MKKKTAKKAEKTFTVDEKLDLLKDAAFDHRARIEELEEQLRTLQRAVLMLLQE